MWLLTGSEHLQKRYWSAVSVEGRIPKGRGEQRQWTPGTTYLRKTWHHHGKKANFNRQCSALRNILMGNLGSCCRTPARQLSNPWGHHLSMMRTLKDLLLTSCCQRKVAFAAKIKMIQLSVDSVQNYREEVSREELLGREPFRTNITELQMDILD